jgi:hypothetical protein
VSGIAASGGFAGPGEDSTVKAPGARAAIANITAMKAPTENHRPAAHIGEIIFC